jgi:hypothetical protein
LVLLRHELDAEWPVRAIGFALKEQPCSAVTVQTDQRLRYGQRLRVKRFSRKDEEKREGH